jgi:hypothetical protein
LAGRTSIVAFRSAKGRSRIHSARRKDDERRSAHDGRYDRGSKPRGLLARRTTPFLRRAKDDAVVLAIHSARREGTTNDGRPSTDGTTGDRSPGACSRDRQHRSFAERKTTVGLATVRGHRMRGKTRTCPLVSSPRPRHPGSRSFSVDCFVDGCSAEVAGAMPTPRHATPLTPGLPYAVRLSAGLRRTDSSLVVAAAAGSRAATCTMRRSRDGRSKNNELSIRCRRLSGPDIVGQASL